MGRRGLDESGSARGQVAAYCEYCDAALCYVTLRYGT
jgi:hypothetical protein